MPSSKKYFLKQRVSTLFLLLRNIYRYDRKLTQWRDDFESLMLTELDIRRLYNIFRHIDVDGSNEIDVLEMLMYMDIESTVFTRQVFSIMDVDGSGQVDFREFVLSVWNYATLGDEALYLFSFDMYDRDCSNELDISEIGRMLKDLYGKNFESNKRAMKLYQKISASDAQKFGPFEFREFAKSHPALFFPAFEMQRKLQNKVLGKRFWKNHAQKRVARSGTEYVRVKDLIGLRTRPDEGVAMTASESKSYESMAAVHAMAHDTKVKQLMELTNTRQKRAEHKYRLTVPQARPRRKSRDDTANLSIDFLLERQKAIDNIIQRCSKPDKCLGNPSSPVDIATPIRTPTQRRKLESKLSTSSTGTFSCVRSETIENSPTDLSELDDGRNWKHSRYNGSDDLGFGTYESTPKSKTQRSTLVGFFHDKRRIAPIPSADLGPVHPIIGQLHNSPLKKKGVGKKRRHSIG